MTREQIIEILAPGAAERRHASALAQIEFNAASRQADAIMKLSTSPTVATFELPADAEGVTFHVTPTPVAAEESGPHPATAPGGSDLDRVARAISFSIGTISDKQAIEAAEDALATLACGEEFLEFKEALDDVRGLRAEYECLNGGGPGWGERNRAAWARVDELFANDDEAAYDRQQESFYG